MYSFSFYGAKPPDQRLCPGKRWGHSPKPPNSSRFRARHNLSLIFFIFRNASLIITHNPDVERTVLKQFIVLPYWRHHLLHLIFYPNCKLYPTKSLNHPTQAYSTQTIFFPTLLYPSLYPALSYTIPTHILLYPTLPRIQRFSLKWLEPAWRAWLSECQHQRRITH